MKTNQYSVEKLSFIKHEELELSYKLLKSTSCDSFAVYESFSLFASVENSLSGYYDEKLVKDVTSSNDTALYLFKLISKGAVTPLTLTEVIEDLLAAC